MIKKYIFEINLAKKALKDVLKTLKYYENKKLKNYNLRSNSKEVKSKIDYLCHNIIIKYLKKTKFPIISEEKANHDFLRTNNYQWIIDPIDGTFNYINKLGSCSSCISLYFREEPIFGIVVSFPDEDIYFGGPNFGSFKNKQKIKISQIKTFSQSVLMTGFPSNFYFDNKNLTKLFKIYKDVKKVRMIGAASLSILKLAEGKANIYYEKNIMIWDVAASLAILRGSNCKSYFLKNTRKKNSFEILCTINNNFLKYFFNKKDIKKIKVI